MGGSFCLSVDRHVVLLTATPRKPLVNRGCLCWGVKVKVQESARARSPVKPKLNPSVQPERAIVKPKRAQVKPKGHPW